MFSHVHVGVCDFERAVEFYTPLMEILGMPLRFCDPGKPWAGWMTAQHGRPLFLIGYPFEGGPAAPGAGQMVAFQAVDREMVRRSHAFAVSHGGTDAGPPGLRPHYHPDFFGAYFRDPDGNKLCVCCHDPES